MQESANLAAERSVVPAVDTDLRTALEQSALEAAMQESANLAASAALLPAAVVDAKEPSLHFVLRLRGESPADAELSGENSSTESDS